MSLQDQLNTLRKQFETSRPEHEVKIMHDATEALRAGGILDRVLTPGTPAPPFDLPSPDANLSLSALLAKGWLILGFYRGVW